MTESDREAGEAEQGDAVPPWKKAVGYLKGRGGGGTVRAGESQAEWRGLFAELRARLDALEAGAVGLEAAMESVAEALMRSQPPMYRRLVVRWWRLWTGRLREPMLVRIEGGAGGRVKLERVGRGIRLRTDRGYGLCADLAKRAVAEYWALHGVRGEMAEQAAELKRLLGRGAARRTVVVARVQAEAVAIQAEAVERLREIGYVVEAGVEPEEEDGDE